VTAQTTRLAAVASARFTSFLNVIMSGSHSCFAKQRRVPGQAEVFVVVFVIAETATRVCLKDPLPVRQVKQQQEATSLWSRWRGLIPTATSRADFRRVEQRNEPDQPVISGFHGTDLYPHGLACHPRSLGVQRIRKILEEWVGNPPPTAYTSRECDVGGNCPARNCHWDKTESILREPHLSAAILVMHYCDVGWSNASGGSFKGVVSLDSSNSRKRFMIWTPSCSLRGW
jgi:hypothetical protein